MKEYGKVYNFGTNGTQGILMSEVWVQEKVDGSQIRWWWDSSGDLHVHSRRSKINHGDPPNLFKPSVEHLKTLEPNQGYVFFGEAIWKPRHNVIKYDRCPAGHIVLWDVYSKEQDGFLLPEIACGFAVDFGLEWAPVYIERDVPTPEKLKQLMDNESFLGGHKIEGVVVKSYRLKDRDGNRLKAKVISDAFRETKGGRYRSKLTGVQKVIDILSTNARYDKAIQRVIESGECTYTMKDMPQIIREVHRDIDEEVVDIIKEKLLKEYIREIKKGVCSGVAAHYQFRLTGLEGGTFCYETKNVPEEGG